jgi:hypothetical protein
MLDSGALTTTHAPDLLVIATFAQNTFVTPGTGLTPRTVQGTQVVADEPLAAAQTLHATAMQDAGGWWLIQAIAFSIR